MKKERSSAPGLEMEFRGGLREEVTAHAGVALLVEVGRRSGVMAPTDRVLPAKKNPCPVSAGIDKGRFGQYNYFGVWGTLAVFP
ncbi:MAG: hypothetical protein ACUVXG_13360 [Anaerolineae bacterium]